MEEQILKTIESVFTVFNIVAFIASLVSIIIAIVAFVMSILFYRWADKSSKNIENVSQEIRDNTKKIEIIFDKLYSDTFGIMKSNIEAMQTSCFCQPISSGDSSQSSDDQLDSMIYSILVKSNGVTEYDLCLLFSDFYKGAGYKNADIHDAVNRIMKAKKCYLNDRKQLISLSLSHGNSSDGGKKSES